MKFTRRLLLTAREYESMLSVLDVHSAANEGRAVRAHARQPFRTTTIPFCVHQPEGGQSCFYVYGRNISAGGISIIHGGFMHSDSDCKLVLRSTDGEMIAVAGTVRHCRYIEHLSHEIGIQFLEEIDLSRFLDDGCEPAAPHERAPAPKYDGTVLIVESFEPDRRLLEHYVRERNLRPITVTTSGAALDVINTEAIDVVYSGLDPLDEHGVYLVRMMRHFDEHLPIIMMTSDNSPNTLVMISQSGANDLLVKPIDRNMLDAQLDRFLKREGPRGRLISQAQDDSVMRELVAQYVLSLGQIASELRRASALEDLISAREWCCRIKGSALSYGYPTLTVAALRAIDEIDRHGHAPESRAAIRTLLDTCDRVQSPALDGPAIVPLPSESHARDASAA